MGFPVGWTKYQSIPINGSSDGELTNYQVEITVPFQSGMKSDFGDIRFTLEEGTELSYHLVSYDASSALFVVKIPTLPTTGINIRCYYGNPDATTTSDPENTYEFYDDFNGVAINTEKWSIDANGVFSIDNGRLKNTGSFGKYIRAKVGGSVYNASDVKIEAIMKSNGGYNEGAILLRGQASPPANSYFVNSTTNGNHRWQIFRRANSATSILCNAVKGTFVLNTDQKVKVTLVGNNIVLYINDVQVCTASPTNFANGSIGIFAIGKTTTWYEDFRVSKTTTNPPTVGTFGSVVDFILEAGYFRTILEIKLGTEVQSYFRGKFKVVEDVVSRFRGKFEIAPEKVRFRTKLMIREEKFKQFRAKFRTITSNPTYTSAIKRFRAKIEAIPIEKKRFRAKVNIDSGKTRLELFANVKLRQSEFEDSFEDFEFTIGDQKYDT